MENFKIEQTDDLKGIVELEFPKLKFKGSEHSIWYMEILCPAIVGAVVVICFVSENTAYKSIYCVLLLLLAALLAFSAGKNGDKVGLLLFTDRVELYLPPRKGILSAAPLLA